MLDMVQERHDSLIDVSDPAALRSLMGNFASGVVVVTAIDDGEPVGLTAQSFVSLSLDPALVLFCPSRTSSSWPRIERAGGFAVNVLEARHVELCQGFARKGGNKFDGVAWHPSPVTGSPVIEGSLAYIDCGLYANYDGGDHTIAVGQVHAAAATSQDSEPLVFFRGDFGIFASAAT